MHIELSYDDWEEQFKPIIWNTKDNISYLETYGKEYECVCFMLAFFPNHVWTESCHDYITNGWHFVDRMHYHITEKPFDPNNTYEVLNDSVEQDCNNCGKTSETLTDCEWCNAAVCDDCLLDVGGDNTCPDCEIDALREKV